MNQNGPVVDMRDEQIRQLSEELHGEQRSSEVATMLQLSSIAARTSMEKRALAELFGARAQQAKTALVAPGKNAPDAGKLQQIAQQHYAGAQGEVQNLIGFAARLAYLFGLEFEDQHHEGVLVGIGVKARSQGRGQGLKIAEE